MLDMEPCESGPTLSGLSDAHQGAERLGSIALTLELINQRGETHADVSIAREVEPWHATSLRRVAAERADATVDGLFHEYDRLPWQRGPGWGDQSGLGRVAQAVVKVNVDDGHGIGELEIVAVVAGLRLHAHDPEARQPVAHACAGVRHDRIEGGVGAPPAPPEREDVRVDQVRDVTVRAVVEGGGNQRVAQPRLGDLARTDSA